MKKGIKYFSYRMKIVIFVLLYTAAAVFFALISFIVRIDGDGDPVKRFSMVLSLFNRGESDEPMGEMLLFASLPIDGEAEGNEALEERRFRVIIDPGHGGPDPGASGITGEAEKHLNLSISKDIAEHLRAYGVQVLLTREDDRWLAEENASHKKHSDVSSRVEFARSTLSDAFISIHMNAFPQEDCKGTQVFYSPNSPESKLLGEVIQKNTVSLLQPNNNRLAKKAGSSIYVLDNIETCAVLIECGFISNYEEAMMLNDGEYRNKLAFVIASSIYEYLTGGKE